MTSTLNGIGTYLSGKRKISTEELARWSEYLPIKPYTSHPEFYIATESIVFLFLPLFPIKTFVYYYVESGLFQDKYIMCYYPAGEGKIYWEHVKNSYAFYIIPAIMAGIMAAFIFKYLVDNFI